MNKQSADASQLYMTPSCWKRMNAVEEVLRWTKEQWRTKDTVTDGIDIDLKFQDYRKNLSRNRIKILYCHRKYRMLYK